MKERKMIALPWTRLGLLSTALALTWNSNRLGDATSTRTAASAFVVNRQAQPRARCAMDVLATKIETSTSLDYEMAVHRGIQELRELLPTFVSQPLSTIEKGASCLGYADDFSLSIQSTDKRQEIVLASNKQDFMGLADVLFLSRRATQVIGGQAWNNLERALSGRNTLNSTTSDMDQDIVECQILLDASNQTHAKVAWKTRVVAGIASNNQENAFNNIQGLSEFHWSVASGSRLMLQSHKILNVTWNKRPLNGPTVGQFVQNLQAAAGAPPNNPFSLFSNNPNVAKIFQEVRTGVLEQAVAGRSKKQPTMLAPVLVLSTEEYQAKSSCSFWSFNSSTSSLAQPIPGTDAWMEYARGQVALQRFQSKILPLLSSPTSSLADIQDLFVPNASLVAMDGRTVYLQGATEVARYYASLAVPRRQGLLGWNCTNCTLVDKNTLQVDYVSELPLPLGIPNGYENARSSSLARIRGRDVYLLSSPVSNPDKTLIERVYQKAFRLEWNKNASLPVRPKVNETWLMESMIAAIQGNRLLSVDVLSDLVQQSVRVPTKIATPSFSPQASANILSLMTNLHSELEQALKSSGNIGVPGAATLSDKVRLEGPLGDILVQGKSNYQRLVGTALNQVRQAVQRGDARLKSPPKSQLVWTPQARLLVKWTWDLELVPPKGLPLPPSVRTNSPALPLRLDWTSEYIFDPTTGMIQKHVLLETRVNGQLTPGDVVVRWLKNGLSPPSNPSASLSSLMELWNYLDQLSKR